MWNLHFATVTNTFWVAKSLSSLFGFCVDLCLIPSPFKTSSLTLPPGTFHSQDSGLSDTPLSSVPLRQLTQQLSDFCCQLCAYFSCCIFCVGSDVVPQMPATPRFLSQIGLFNPILTLSIPTSLNLFMCPSPSSEAGACYESQAGLKPMFFLPPPSPYANLLWLKGAQAWTIANCNWVHIWQV